MADIVDGNLKIILGLVSRVSFRDEMVGELNVMETNRSGR